MLKQRSLVSEDQAGELVSRRLALAAAADHLLHNTRFEITTPVIP